MSFWARVCGFVFVIFDWALGRFGLRSLQTGPVCHLHHSQKETCHNTLDACNIFFSSIWKMFLNIGFLICKITGLSSWSQRGQRKNYPSSVAWDIGKKVAKYGSLVWMATFWQFFVNISGYSTRIIFLFATLWPWAQPRYFAYKKPSIWDLWVFEFLRNPIEIKKQFIVN